MDAIIAAKLVKDGEQATEAAKALYWPSKADIIRKVFSFFLCSERHSLQQDSQARERELAESRALAAAAAR